MKKVRISYGILTGTEKKENRLPKYLKYCSKQQCRKNQKYKTVSQNLLCFFILFFPIKMAARGAPPILTRAAKADIAIITGIATPTPVKALAHTSGICPINMRSTILYKTLII